MALSISEKPKYEKLYHELLLHVKPPYTEAVVNILAQKGIEATERQVRNVVRHHKMDFEILYVLREYFGLVPDPDAEIKKKSLLKTQKLNAPQE